MHRKLVFVLAMFAVAIGSLSQAQAVLASQRLPARAASAAHAGRPASIATHSATRAVRVAAATRPMAPHARLRTQEKQGSLPLGRDQRATETPSAPQLTSAASLTAPKTTSVGLPISRACQITISGSTIFIVGQFGSFIVTVTGSPPCQLSVVGALPPGPTWTDNGDGTATISGTPAANTGGTYPITITATNGASPDAIQSFTLTVDQVCQITSADSATFAVGQAGTLTVTTTGYPRCILPAPLTLPSGVTFTDNADGTATLAGTPAANTGGTYQFTINATNDVIPDATQSFTLTVDQACQITSADSATFAVGQAGTFTVTTTGYPTCILPAPLTLPSRVTFTDNADGTATLAGTPAANTGGTYQFTINATNGASPDATQAFTLTVNQAPRITSPASTTFTAGQAGTFTVKSTGVPNSTLSETGALPSGVKFKDNGDGTATLAGTPAVGSSGPYPFTIAATNAVSPDATQAFALTVNQVPSIISADHTTCTAGKACAFTVTSTGAPTPGLSETGALPRGVRFKDNGDGTAALSGTPAAGTGGTYTLTIAATNGVSPAATHSFTLTVVGLPAAPSGLKATSRGRSVSLTWTNHASAPSAAKAILIQRSTNAGFTTGIINTTIGPTVTTHIDTRVVKGKRYYYRVRAHNAVGNSAWSNVSNVTAP